MFYYLLYNSSFSFIVESRLFSTILYGSILYILTHAVLNYCDISILNIINNYYWTLFTLDIISFLYALYQSILNGNNNQNGQNDLNVSFNLIKNKINTMLDRKNDLTITQIPIQQQQNNLQNNYNNTNTINNNNNTNNNTNKQNNKNKFSTPISQLQNLKQNTNTNKASTPISIIRNNVNILEPIIDDENDQPDFYNQSTNSNNQYSGSVAGSDVGSIMDLADFETTL